MNRLGRIVGFVLGTMFIFVQITISFAIIGLMSGFVVFWATIAYRVLMFLLVW